MYLVNMGGLFLISCHCCHLNRDISNTLYFFTFVISCHCCHFKSSYIQHLFLPCKYRPILGIFNCPIMRLARHFLPMVVTIVFQFSCDSQSLSLLDCWSDATASVGVLQQLVLECCNSECWSAATANVGVLQQLLLERCNGKSWSVAPTSVGVMK